MYFNIYILNQTLKYNISFIVLNLKVKFNLFSYSLSLDISEILNIFLNNIYNYFKSLPCTTILASLNS